MDSGSTAVTKASTRACPKCGKKAPADAESCPRCGLVFALWNDGAGDSVVAPLDAGGAELWEDVKRDWLAVAKHDAFLKHCLRAGSLAAAGRLYRDRLDEAPGDAIAAQMQAQVLAKATLGLNVQRSQPRESIVRSRWFWVVVLTAMAVGIGGGLFWQRLAP